MGDLLPVGPPQLREPDTEPAQPRPQLPAAFASTTRAAAKSERAPRPDKRAFIDRFCAGRRGDLVCGGDVGWGRWASGARSVERGLVFRGADGLEKRFRGDGRPIPERTEHLL